MAVITFEYWFSENNRKRSMFLDDSTDNLTGGQGAIVDTGQPSKAVGELVYSDASYEVYATREIPYGYVKRITGCAIPLPTIVDVTFTKVGVVYDITIDYLNATAMKLFGIAGNPDSPTTSLITSPKTVSGYPPGQYVLVLYKGFGSNACITDQIITVVPDLSATCTASPETSDGLDDGSINVNITDGSGNYRVDWVTESAFTNLVGSNPQSTTRTGLAPGVYEVTVTDLISGQVLEFEVEVTAALAGIAPGSLLQVPMMNSLHFVVNQTPDECTIFQGLDNVLFCQQQHPYFARGFYHQKVCKCDNPPIQFNSDYTNHTVELKDYVTGTVVKSFPVIKKEENIGKKETFGITIRNHTIAGQSRVYFNTGAPPIPIAAGDAFEILNNADGFNGNYIVVSVETDLTLGYQYIVINKNYAIVATSTTGDGRFDVTTTAFDVYEFVASMLDVADGIYYITIRAFDDDSEKIATSEPINLKVSHPDTNLVIYRNNDNAFGMTWQTGIICRVRVESVFFKRLPGGERTLSRNSDYSLVKVAAKKARIILFETFMLPPYLHEKLSVVFDCDFISIQNVQVQASEGYGEPQYITRYKLANSSIKVEQVGWFDSYNSDDIGSVAEGGLILIEDSGFILQ